MSSGQEKASCKARVAGSHSVSVSVFHVASMLGTTGGFCTKEEKVRRVFEKTDWSNFAYHDLLGDHFEP
jgi:hypothetical protein